MPKYYANKKINKTPYETNGQAYVIPKFMEPRKILVDEMTDLINEHCPKQTEIFRRVLNAMIRTRIAKLLTGKTISEVNAMPAEDLVDLYHKNYDAAENEKLVKDAYKLVETACWPAIENKKGDHYYEELESHDKGNDERPLFCEDSNPRTYD